MGELSGLLIRVIHIFCGTFWLGAALMLAGFIEPAVDALGPEGGKFIQRMVGPGRFGLFMTVAAALTALSGLLMLWLQSGGDLGTWLESGYGITIVVGSVVGFIALIWGLSVNAPTAARLARLGGELQAAGAPPGADQMAEIARLQRRLATAGIVSALLLGLSVVAMAAARYM